MCNCKIVLVFHIQQPFAKWVSFLKYPQIRSAYLVIERVVGTAVVRAIKDGRVGEGVLENKGEFWVGFD